MKKGDLRKQEILYTAEQLFCRKGYEQTSIQDILDQLHSSKGSFYHHFISKESLLEGICRMRAEQIYRTVSSSVNDTHSASRNLNLLLSGMIPLMNEKLLFILMLIPIFSLPEGRMVRMSYCDSLAGLFSPDVSKWLNKGHDSEELYCPDPEISAGLILTLVNRLWVMICDIIISAEESGKEPDLSALFQLTERYRLAIEPIISLPLGSVELIRPVAVIV